MLKGFKNWLANSRRFLFKRYTKDLIETQEPERTLVQLPPELREKLIERVANLPINPGDREAISTKLDEVYETWDANSISTNNSMVVLSSPVTSVSRILTETLESWAEQKQISFRPLPLKARPEIADTIKSKLQHYLEQEFVQEAIADRQSEVVIIPNLSWCFLRSWQGLEGIEYLQSRLHDGFQDRFWIIGGGQVSWEYLNSVSNIEAYCKEVFTLPALTAEQLADWLQPIVEELNITFEDPELNRQILDNDKDNRTHYFECLADISQGVSNVAVQAFLKSIHYEEDNEDNKEQHALGVVAKTPQLPELPDLDASEQYLLYSILLHGDLTISALAESLGDGESEVQAKVQALRHQGVVEQQGKIVKINPIHYPNVKRELANNNFVINKR